jgi:hypothetical protein
LDPRRVKWHWPYTVNEIAELFSLHPHSVRRWLKTGLAPVEGNHRPTLVRGKELYRFVTDLRGRRKRSCGAGRLFCVKCREPRIPGGNMAEINWLSPTTANLIGIGPVCFRMMNRRVSLRSLEQAIGKLDVSETNAQQRLSECL